MLKKMLFLLVPVSADDASCVLTLNATAKTAELDPFNYDDRWMESYKDQIYALGTKLITAKIAEMVVGGILGEFVSLFISIFFPPPGTKREEALLKIVMEWTVKYVGEQEAALVRDLAQAHLDTAKDILEKDYEPASAKLLAAVEEAKNFTFRTFRRPPVFPEDAWFRAESSLRQAWGSANTARNTILDGGSQLPRNKSRAQGIPTYIAAVTLAMSLRRQLHNITLLKDTWPHPWQGTSKESDRMVKEMKDQYKKYTEEMKTKMIEAWKQWRFSLVTFDFKFFLHDDLLDKNIDFVVPPGLWAFGPTWWHLSRLQYERYLFANELVPMVKPFLLLIRIVPGQEKAYLTRGPLPEVLTIGPWSRLFSGIYTHNDWRFPPATPPWPADAVRSTRRRTLVGSDRVMARGIKGSKYNIGQLIFKSGYHNTVIVRFPEVDNTKIEDRRLYRSALMPAHTCGIDATYFYWGMAQFVAINKFCEASPQNPMAVPTVHVCSLLHTLSSVALHE
ncbi:unnamed protein product [Symbiodinium microadriaticum]|nr:unnamed protein product [Symbiodinium microadriaticum]